jgi:hypothetical protein
LQILSLSLAESQSLSLMLERVDRGHGPGLINETSRGFDLWLVHTCRIKHAEMGISQ